MNTVLLALDDSDSAYFAALTATSLFGAEASYLAVHVEPAPTGANEVWGPVYGYGYPAVAPTQLHDPTSRREAIDEARLIAAEHTGALGLEATPVGDVGDPAQAIGRIAHDHGVDVVVVGESRRGWLSRLLSLSVTDDLLKSDLLKSARVPLLVVPAPDDWADAAVPDEH